MKPPDAAPSPPRIGAVLLGIARVARGRKDGLLQFGNTRQSFLASMAPLMAFLLVGAALGLLGGNRGAVEYVAAGAVLLLGSLVSSFEIARYWKRADRWLHFATAFCWCQWAAPMALLAVMLLMALAVAGGASENAAAGMGLAALFAYGLWLYWFVARHALGVSAVRAAIMVLCTNVATTVLLALPQLADYAVNGPSPSP